MSDRRGDHGDRKVLPVSGWSSRLCNRVIIHKNYELFVIAVDLFVMFGRSLSGAFAAIRIGGARRFNSLEARDEA
jgi:hypothetical protein